MNWSSLPFGLVVPQVLQAEAGLASPHQDVEEGCTTDKGHKSAFLTAAKAREENHNDRETLICFVYDRTYTS